MAALIVKAPAQDGVSGLVTDFTGPDGEAALVTRGDYVLRGTVLAQYQGEDGDVVIPADLGLTEIGDQAFGRATIRSVKIPEGVTKLGDRLFIDCYDLVSVAIPKTVSLIGDRAFAQCGKLKEITVDKANASYTDRDGVLFSRDLSLLITYPAGKTAASYAAPEGLKNIGDYAFSGCDSLSSISLPAGLARIGDYAFDGCDSLAEINLPAGLAHIGDRAFSGCAFTSISVPDGVATIGDSAFAWCGSIKSISLPASLTGMGTNVFSGCGSLTAIQAQAPAPPALSGNLWSSWAKPPVTIYVPAAAVDAYKNAEGWKNHGDQIQAAE